MRWSTGLVSNYCKRFASSGETLTAFARWFCIHEPDAALRIMEMIGSWPSSEPELRALQQAHGRGGYRRDIY